MTDKKRSASWTSFRADSLAENSYSEISRIGEDALRQCLNQMENDLEQEKHYFNPAYYLDLKWQLEHARHAKTHRLPECLREAYQESP
jgi:hypothetical protein